MEKIKVRFPNESSFVDVVINSITEFRKESVFGDDVFGYWKGNYVSIYKPDYLRLKEKTTI